MIEPEAPQTNQEKISAHELEIQLSIWRALGADPIGTEEGKELFATLVREGVSPILLGGISGGMEAEIEADGKTIKIPRRETF